MGYALAGHIQTKCVGVGVRGPLEKTDPNTERTCELQKEVPTNFEPEIRTAMVIHIYLLLREIDRIKLTFFSFLLMSSVR